MTQGNMAVCVKLLFTILVILNSICLVSLQDDLEHGLATDCLMGKGMKAELIKSCSKLTTKSIAF